MSWIARCTWCCGVNGPDGDGASASAASGGAGGGAGSGSGSGAAVAPPPDIALPQLDMSDPTRFLNAMLQLVPNRPVDLVNNDVDEGLLHIDESVVREQSRRKRFEANVQVGSA